MTHFCPVILARIDSASLSWTILTKNKGHISARIYLTRVISAFVGWIISAGKHFCPENSGKASAKIGLNEWGTFLHKKFWPPHSKVSRTQLFQQGHCGCVGCSTFHAAWKPFRALGWTWVVVVTWDINDVIAVSWIKRKNIGTSLG